MTKISKAKVLERIRNNQMIIKLCKQEICTCQSLIDIHTVLLERAKSQLEIFK